MISHRHKCIFIHIPKCGGQSIEYVFIKENNLTEVTRDPLLLRRNDNSLIGPPRLAHLSYHEYLKYSYVSQEMMEQYTVFTVVRNPYDRAISLYKYLGFNYTLSFEDFVCKYLRHNIVSLGEMYWFVKPQYQYLCSDDDKIAVHEVIKLENIDVEIIRLFQKLGLNHITLEHRNKSVEMSLPQRLRIKYSHFRKGFFTFNGPSSSDVEWTKKSLAVINELYANDFRLFEYQIKTDTKEL